jgi:hypothetical protein
MPAKSHSNVYVKNLPDEIDGDILYSLFEVNYRSTSASPAELLLMRDPCHFCLRISGSSFDFVDYPDCCMQNHGNIKSACVMVDQITKKSRNFGKWKPCFFSGGARVVKNLFSSLSFCFI